MSKADAAVTGVQQMFPAPSSPEYQALPLVEQQYCNAGVIFPEKINSLKKTVETSLQSLLTRYSDIETHIRSLQTATKHGKFKAMGDLSATIIINDADNNGPLVIKFIDFPEG
jgi:hypothetical protein